jgi:hypothetical protein
LELRSFVYRISLKLRINSLQLWLEGIDNQVGNDLTEQIAAARAEPRLISNLRLRCQRHTAKALSQNCERATLSITIIREISRFHLSAMLSTHDPSVEPFDRQKWNALLEHDSLIAEIARKLTPLGQKRLDEFAATYLALNDKRDLPVIVQKIIAQARNENEELERCEAAQARRTKIALVASVIIFSVALLGYAIVTFRAKYRSFEERSEQFNAKQLGINDRMAWNSYFVSEQKRQERQQANLAAAEAKRKSDELAPQPTAEALAREEARCARDLHCLGARYLPDATVACTSVVERLAKKNFEWFDEWDKPKFSNYRWKNRECAVISYLGDKIKFQNDFGAWIPSVYECDFDTKANSVVDVRVNGGEIEPTQVLREIRD